MTSPADGSERKLQRAGTARAGLAGAGGGTGLVAIAHALPEGSPWREILLYAAPAASVLFGTAVYFVQVQATRVLQRRLVRRFRRTIEEYLRNPLTSEEHKADLRRSLEEVERVMTLQEVEHIRVIGSLPKAPEAAPAPEGAALRDQES